VRNAIVNRGFEHSSVGRPPPRIGPGMGRAGNSRAFGALCRRVKHAVKIKADGPTTIHETVSYAGNR